MATICPSILAANDLDYRRQMARIAHVARRIQIDLTDGDFSSPKTIDASRAWWPVGFAADFHLMFKNPLPTVEVILEHRPNLLIIHAEAEGDFNQVVNICRQAGVKVGVALLSQTSVDVIQPALHLIDHVLIFSGDLGKFGGRADLSLLQKAVYLKHHKPQLEIGWDGGINDQNIAALVTGGVDVLAVGGYLQHSADPERTFRALQRIADETGTT